MSSQTREKLIIMFFPAVMVAAIYMLSFSKGSLVSPKAQELEAARTAAVPQAVVTAERAKLADLKSQVAKLNDEKRGLDARWLTMVSRRDVGAQARAEACQRLMRMLWKQGLFTIEESLVEGGSQKLPSALEETIKRLSEGNSTTAETRIWKVRFLGRYPDVMATLKSISTDTGGTIIPVSISMSEARLETDWRSWTLLVWM